MAGAVPVGRGLRALTIFLAVPPAAVVAGVALAAISSSLRHVRFVSPPHDAATPT